MFDRSVCTSLTYASKPSPGAKPTGKFAIRPIAEDARADMAAVVVISSRRTSSTQARYTGSLVQRSFVEQTHVPPLSERMAAFTDSYASGQGRRKSVEGSLC